MYDSDKMSLWMTNGDLKKEQIFNFEVNKIRNQNYLEMHEIG